MLTVAFCRPWTTLVTKGGPRATIITEICYSVWYRKAVAQIVSRMETFTT
jgi:hypothetical protein